MMRSWLRSVIGWEDIGASLVAMRDHCVKLEDLIMAQGREIEQLKYMRSQREAKTQSRLINDWERIQSEYAANPENFKEN